MENINQPLSVFYSWQSDTPNNLNRNFIEKALEAAIGRIGGNAELNSAPRVELDKDTAGVAGSPAVVETILAKIETCAAFVADLTFVGKSGPELERPEGASRQFPNPNVLIEYGYALRARTDRAIVAVMNTAYGDRKSVV